MARRRQRTFYRALDHYILALANAEAGRLDDPAFDAGQAEVVDPDVDPFRVMSVKASDEIDRAAEIPAVRGGAFQGPANSTILRDSALHPSFASLRNTPST